MPRMVPTGPRRKRILAPISQLVLVGLLDLQSYWQNTYGTPLDGDSSWADLSSWLVRAGTRSGV